MIIYLARNDVNGHAYIGKTRRPLKKRMKEHYDDAMAGSELPFSRAIRKHGFESFSWMRLAQGCNDEHLNELERRFIKIHRTYEEGYNATRGGDGILGYRHTTETKARMSEARRGEGNCNWGGLSEEHKRNVSLGKVGTGSAPRPHMRGRKHSKETKLKIGLGSNRQKVPIAIEQLSIDGNLIAGYPSLNQAAQSVAGTGPGIKRCCEGQSSYRGFVWRYLTKKEKSQ